MPITHTLSNGNPVTTDGAVRLKVDGLGMFGTPRPFAADAIFNPEGPTPAAPTVYSSNVYLSSADELLQDCEHHVRAQEVSRSPSSLVTRATVGGIRIDLSQELGPITGGGSTLTQTYTLKNASAAAADLVLVRHVDGDLRFDGSIVDGGAASPGGKVLYEYDSSDDPTSPSTFFGISGALDADDKPDRWTIQRYDYRDDIVKADGIPAGDNGVVRTDANGDGIVDTPFDVTVSQQWNVPSLAPGASVTFVTSTRWGRQPPRPEPPDAGDDSYTTNEDTVLTVPAPGVLGNDTNEDSAAVTAVLARGVANGALTLNADGSFVYSPAANFNGTDSFTYQADDGARSEPATVTITVNPMPEPKQTLTVVRIGNARIVSDPAGIDCGEVCSAEFEADTVVTLTATPDPGWAFSGWGGACGGSASCVVTVDAGKAVTATFALPPPTPGVNVNATPVAGDVLVKVAGTDRFVPLSQPTLIPMGSQFDATRGRVQLTAARAGGVTDISQFSEGTFALSQPTPRAIAELRLVLGDFSVCSLPSFAAADRNRRPVRRLWGSGKGTYRTRGRFSSATVRGTVWKTEDRCDGTLTVVREGAVTVRDLTRRKDIIVRAGKSYLAEPLPRGMRSAGCTIVGTSRRDVLRGTARRDVICGLDGNDVIYGLGGNDKILGGAGADRLLGGRGRDLLEGGPGNDWMNGGPGADTVRGGRGVDLLVSGKDGADQVRGGPGADRCKADGVRACP